MEYSGYPGYPEYPEYSEYPEHYYCILYNQNNNNNNINQNINQNIINIVLVCLGILYCTFGFFNLQ